MSNLTSVTKVKKFLNITDISSDVIIYDIVKSVCQMIETAANRIFAAADYTEYFDGDKNSIAVRNYPLNSVASVNDDPMWTFAEGTIIDPIYYKIETNSGLIHFDYLLSKGKRNVKVVYNGGYSTIPLDIELAATMRSAALFLQSQSNTNTQEGQNLQNERIKNLNDSSETIMEKYRNPANV